MAWTTEDAPEVETDLEAIYDHLFASHLGFGNSEREAAMLAAQRVDGIAATRLGIARAPYRGTQHTVRGRSCRHVTIDRAIYWFTLDEGAEVLRVEAIFFGGQDHAGRMFARLTSEGEGAP
ncbi:type II toxin-antitoxin system RelE/ParE family toxin [Sagittula sp. S175]|uniref:type II toxin-antitoxin system RelE/ParE family toxin n=1 Tax=Sagittula sp. S175 TaxID=3415129 RepID=UPI003C7AEE71